MNLLISVIVAGMATAFVLSILELALGWLLSAQIIRFIFTLPLAVYANYILGYTDYFVVAVAGCGAAFFALTLIMLTKRVAEAPQVIERRRL